jgi:integrase
MSNPSLYDAEGQRKYQTEKERRVVLEAAKEFPRTVRTFTGTHIYTGCRISEALALTIDRVDLSDRCLVFESLKKRQRGIYRAVPVPASFIDELDMVHGIREAQRKPGGGKGIRLWEWSRTTGWRRLKEVFDAADIGEGTHAAPKGLRHGFGVAAVTNGIPLTSVQKWCGHAQITTTAIYVDAIGEEERVIASRMWNPLR